MSNLKVHQKMKGLVKLMHYYHEPGGMRHGVMSGMMGYSWLWIVGLILLVIIILIGAFILIKQLQRPEQNQPQTKQEDRPLMILKERFAKGEINEEEYNQKRKVLKDDY